MSPFSRSIKLCTTKTFARHWFTLHLRVCYLISKDDWLRGQVEKNSPSTSSPSSSHRIPSRERRRLRVEHGWRAATIGGRLRVLVQSHAIISVFLRGNGQVEVHPKEERDFERIHLRARNTAHLFQLFLRFHSREKKKKGEINFLEKEKKKEQTVVENIRLLKSELQATRGSDTGGGRRGATYPWKSTQLYISQNEIFIRKLTLPPLVE